MKLLSHWFNCWSHNSTFSSCTLSVLFYSYLWGKVLFFLTWCVVFCKCIYIYKLYIHIVCYHIPRAPLWPLFLKVNISKQGLNSNQNKGPHLGSRCVNSMNSTLCWTTLLFVCEGMVIEPCPTVIHSHCIYIYCMVWTIGTVYVHDLNIYLHDPPDVSEKNKNTIPFICFAVQQHPIGSMYGIFTYTYHKNQPFM